MWTRLFSITSRLTPRICGDSISPAANLGQKRANEKGNRGYYREEEFVMNQRFLCCIGGLAVMLAGSTVALGQALSPAAKPAPAVKVKTWIPPRTADGQPDL